MREHPRNIFGAAPAFSYPRPRERCQLNSRVQRLLVPRTKKPLGCKLGTQHAAMAILQTLLEILFVYLCSIHTATGVAAALVPEGSAPPAWLLNSYVQFLKTLHDPDALKLGREHSPLALPGSTSSPTMGPRECWETICLRCWSRPRINR